MAKKNQAELVYSGKNAEKTVISYTPAAREKKLAKNANLYFTKNRYDKKFSEQRRIDLNKKRKQEWDERVIIRNKNYRITRKAFDILREAAESLEEQNID
jgi:hypothetical protein